MRGPPVNEELAERAGVMAGATGGLEDQALQVMRV